MDLVSHAALGGSWAQSSAHTKRLRIVALTAAFAALTPDLDVLIQSPTDPVLTLEYHRQFTHALAFVPFGALVCAALLYRFIRAHLTFAQTYVVCLAGYASHPLLDACTTYGTQLLWPFSDARIAWSVIAVIDPVFTLPALVLVALCALKRRARYARAAAIWAAAYLAFGALQASRAAAAGEALAASRGHTPLRLEVKPGLFSSLVLWKLIYEHDGRYYVDAVRTGFSTSTRSGESTRKLDLATHFPWLSPQSQQAQDVERFRRVAGDFLAVDANIPNRIVDLRYSLVPNEIAGFWAIVLDPNAAPADHVGFVTTRENAPTQALRLLQMLFE